MFGQVTVWVIGANAGSIVLALIAFYQFVMRGLDKRIDYRVGGELRKHIAREGRRHRKLTRIVREHVVEDREAFARLEGNRGDER